MRCGRLGALLIVLGLASTGNAQTPQVPGKSLPVAQAPSKVLPIGRGAPWVFSYYDDMGNEVSVGLFAGPRQCEATRQWYVNQGFFCTPCQVAR